MRFTYYDHQRRHYLFIPTDKAGTDSDGWSVKNSSDSDVGTITAVVKSNKKKAELIVSCTQSSTDLLMKLKVNKTLWRALAYSIENKQETLQIEMSTGEKRTLHTITNWTLESENNVLLRIGSISEPEVSDLKKGKVVKFEIKTVSSNQETKNFEQLKFSLQNSKQSLIQLKNFCSPEAVNN